MNDLLTGIISKIEILNPIHGKKLRKNLQNFEPDYFERANAFLNKYVQYLYNKNKNLDYGIDCYLKMVADMTYEQIRFFETGRYSSTLISDVKQRVYSNPKIMEYYMIGLLLSQFLWMHHYKVFSFFIKMLPKYQRNIKDYLEIGGGHGLCLSEAIRILDNTTLFDFLDISPTSLELSKRFVSNERVRFVLGDIFEFVPEKKYDFIVMGEVLEHVEEPVKLLAKVRNLLSDDGSIYITTPTNAPAIDHIYLFKNIQEIRDVITTANFKIVDEIGVYAENVSEGKAEKLKITLMYGAVLKKNRR